MKAIADEPALAPLDLLRGVRVVELSGSVAGAYCGRLLADLGADVARVAGDLSLDAPESVRQTVAASLHRGKEQIEAPDLDARLLAAQALISDLAPELGNGAAHPGQVVVAIGPDTAPGGGLDWTGCNLTAVAAGAMSWVIGDPDRAPLTLPFDMADYQAGANAASACALGVLLAERGMPAPRFEISTAGVIAYYVGMIAANFVPYERPWRREGRRNAGSGGFYPSALFSCLEGYVAIMCRVPREWDALVEALGRPAWSADPRFADPREIARLHADEVDLHLGAWTGERTRAEVLAAARAFGFPAAPIRTVPEALDEEQIRERGFLRELGRDGAAVRAPGTPFAVRQAPTAAAGGRARTSRETLPATGPLAGLRVLDLSWVWSGPMVTSVLADLGAEVIKVEHGSRLDAARVRGPGVRHGRAVDAPENEASPYFNQINHGKRSVTIDLHDPDGAELVRRLADVSDVLVENMRPGALGRRGLDYETLSARNESLVYLSMSIAGQTGPLSDLKGYAPVMSGMAGLESLFGYGPDDVVGMLTTAFGDPNAAMHALGAVFAALRRRDATGVGAWIDLSQIEALMSVMHAPIVEAEALGVAPVPPANGHARHAPHGHFQCAGDDRWIALAVTDEDQWRALLALAPLADRWGAADAAARVAGRAELEADVAAWTREHERDPLVETLAAAGIPAVAVRTFAEMIESPDVGAASGREVPHPYLGSQFTFFLPWRIDGRLHAAAARAPFLGEHTREDLSRLLGLSEDELDRLESAGSISAMHGADEESTREGAYGG